MQPSEQRSLRNPEIPGSFDIEPARTGLLDQREPEGARSMVSGEGLDLVSDESNRRPDGNFTHLQWKSESVPAGVSSGPKGICRISRPPDHQLLRSPLKAECSKQARKPQVVIRVQMGDEDLLQTEPHAEFHHLALGTLSTVEQIEIALALNRQR
jgi:hypothetical protein